MVSQLRDLGFRRIVLVDGGSIYPRMRDLLSALQDVASVVLVPSNPGPRQVFFDSATRAVAHLGVGGPILARRAETFAAGRRSGYRAPLDTTFATYDKTFFHPDDFLEAIRVAGRFTCRHLSWYRGRNLPAREERFYRNTQSFSYHLGEGDTEIRPHPHPVLR